VKLSVPNQNDYTILSKDICNQKEGKEVAEKLRKAVHSKLIGKIHNVENWRTTKRFAIWSVIILTTMHVDFR
jgi:hypothetical protein